MTKSFFAFCLVAVASFVLFTTSSAMADDAADKAKVAKVSTEVTVSDVDCSPVAPACGRHHVRRFGKLRLPRFEFPEIKLSRHHCVFDRHEVVEADEVAAECDCCGRVVFERNISCAGHFKNVKYIKFPGRFFLKRVVECGENVDVEP
jgi:hypothetical protein